MEIENELMKVAKGQQVRSGFLPKALATLGA